jgi:hypothetical protein
MIDERKQLKAIVAVWLTNGHMPVTNTSWEVNDIISIDEFDMKETFQNLINNNLLKISEIMDEWDNIVLVIPTAKGIFEALS